MSDTRPVTPYDFGELWVTVHYRDDGPTVVEVTRPPDSAMFSLELVAAADPRFMSVEGDVICIHAVNGEFRYRVVSWERMNLSSPGSLGTIRLPDGLPAEGEGGMHEPVWASGPILAEGIPDPDGANPIPGVTL